MTESASRYPAAGVNTISSATTPEYSPNPLSSNDAPRKTRCATGFSFIKSIHGILNIIIIVALICVIISAGVADVDDGRRADRVSAASNVKVSAFHTRNAVLVFAVFGLVLMLADTILHVTKYINRLPARFDFIFIIVMLVFGGIYLILGCCAAAWEKKMNDTAPYIGGIKHKGAGAAASFFLFVTMIAVLVDFGLRLARPVNSASE